MMKREEKGRRSVGEVLALLGIGWFTGAFTAFQAPCAFSGGFIVPTEVTEKCNAARRRADAGRALPAGTLTGASTP